MSARAYHTKWWEHINDTIEFRHLSACPVCMSCLQGLACFCWGFPSSSSIHSVKNSCIFQAKSWEWLNIQIPTLKMEAEAASVTEMVCVLSPERSNSMFSETMLSVSQCLWMQTQVNGGRRKMLSSHVTHVHLLCSWCRDDGGSTSTASPWRRRRKWYTFSTSSGFYL